MHVGMNREGVYVYGVREGVPHARGDEPDRVASLMV